MPTRTVAFVSDLMDRSRLDGLDGVTFGTVADDATGADRIVIDLARDAALVAEVRALAPDARIVAFGSHVDGAALDAARADGADDVMARSRFFRDPAAAIAGAT